MIFSHSTEGNTNILEGSGVILPSISDWFAGLASDILGQRDGVAYGWLYRTLVLRSFPLICVVAH